jgi:TetR/AcrR family transcriptional regulator, cholesterol catabolism regulator
MNELANPKTKIKDLDLVRKKQKQICTGAMKVFRSKGYHEATIREISVASRISLGSLYDYIEGKEDILFLVYMDILEHLYQSIDEAMKRFDNPKDQLIGLLKEFFYLTSLYREEILFAVTETKNLDRKYKSEILNREASFVEAIQTLIEEGVRQGVFECKRPAIFANILDYVMGILPLRGWNILTKYSEEELRDELIGLILKGLNVKITA